MRHTRGLVPLSLVDCHLYESVNGMTLLASLASAQGPLVLLLVILGPSLLPRALNLLLRRRQPRAPSPLSKLPRATRLGQALLALHALYHLFGLVFPPYHVFATHRLPLFVSNNNLRRHVMRYHGLAAAQSLHPSVSGKASSQVELLLQKLQNLDNRLLYSRWGHRPLIDCAWCTNTDDYLVASLPGVLVPYIFTSLVLGVMGMKLFGGAAAGVRKGNWRSSAVWVLVAMAMGEVGIRYLWDLRPVDGDCVQLDPLLHTLRSVLLLILPVLYIYLPLSVPPSPADLLPAIVKTSSTIRLTSLARTAVARNERLAHQWLDAAREEALGASAAQQDAFVRQAAARMGMREEDMRQSARAWVDDGWRSLIRVERSADTGARSGAQ